MTNKLAQISMNIPSTWFTFITFYEYCFYSKANKESEEFTFKQNLYGRAQHVSLETVFPQQQMTYGKGCFTWSTTTCIRQAYIL